MSSRLIILISSKSYANPSSCSRLPPQTRAELQVLRDQVRLYQIDMANLQVKIMEIGNKIDTILYQPWHDRSSHSRLPFLRIISTSIHDFSISILDSCQFSHFARSATLYQFSLLYFYVLPSLFIIPEYANLLITYIMKQSSMEVFEINQSANYEWELERAGALTFRTRVWGVWIEHVATLERVNLPCYSSQEEHAVSFNG